MQVQDILDQLDHKDIGVRLDIPDQLDTQVVQDTLDQLDTQVVQVQDIPVVLDLVILDQLALAMKD